MARFLGLDSSTQSLSAALIEPDPKAAAIYEEMAIKYEECEKKA